MSEDDLTGQRKTKIKLLNSTSEAVVIEDNYKESDDPHRALQDRWSGETWLELKREAKETKDVSKTRKVKVERKRKADSSELPSKEELEENGNEEVDLHPGDPEQQPSVLLDLGTGSQEPLGLGHDTQQGEGAILPRVTGISPLQRAPRSWSGCSGRSPCKS